MTRRNRLRALRNLALAGALLLLVWWLYQCPLPGRLEFRRWERQVLLPPSEILLELDRDQVMSAPCYVGVSGDRAVVYQGWNGEVYPLENGSGLVPLFFLITHDAWGQPVSAAGFAAVRPPEAAERAELTLANRLGAFTAEGWRQGPVFLFAIRPEPDEDGRVSMSSLDWADLERISYRLAFFDASGAPLDLWAYAGRKSVNQPKEIG